ncbi:hypothetical protein ACFX13_016589 [Malus domestica]
MGRLLMDEDNIYANGPGLYPEAVWVFLVMIPLIFKKGPLRVILTYYRISRMRLLLTQASIARKLRMMDSIVRRMVRFNYRNKYCHSKFKQVCSGSPWSNQLPKDIMQLILQRLCVTDYRRCAAVCQSWREIIKSNVQSPRHEVPWLMLCSHPFSNRDHSVLSPSDWKAHKFLRPSPDPIFYCTMNRMDCVGSIEGWLIMMDSALRRSEGFMKPRSLYLLNPENPRFKIDFFFFNPISGDRVMLPSSKSTLPCHCSNGPGFTILKLDASSVPTRRGSREPSFVASLCKGGHIAFCRLTDKSWTSIDDLRVNFFQDIVIMGGKLYATTSHASQFVKVFDIFHDASVNGGPPSSPSYSVANLLTLDPYPLPSYPLPSIDVTTWCGITSRIVHHYNGRDFIYLAKDYASMELFMIFRKVDFGFPTFSLCASFMIDVMGANYHPPPTTKGFRVFKLERDSINGGSRWVQVFDLGDRILFLSRASHKVLSTNYNDLSYYPHGEKLERNCIYFAFDYPYSASPSSGRDFGVFSLSNNSIRHFNFPDNYSGALLHTRTVWFTPNRC